MCVASSQHTSQSNPRAASFKASDFVDDRSIRELDESGIFKQLYGQ
jgi:hypothetical protein